MNLKMMFAYIGTVTGFLLGMIPLFFFNVASTDLHFFALVIVVIAGLILVAVATIIGVNQVTQTKGVC